MGAAQKLRSKLFACYASVRSAARAPHGALHGRRMLPNHLTRWSASIDSLPARGRDAAGAHRRHRQPNETLMMLARSFTPPYFFQKPHRREKRHAIVFFGAVSSRSGHRSVGYHRPCGRRRSETKSSGRGPWYVGLCVVRVSRRTVHRANIALNV